MFAGEEIACKITFKNISNASNSYRSPSPGSHLRTPGPGRERWIESLHSQPQQSPINRNQNFSVPYIISPESHGSAHRPALSLANPLTGLKKPLDISTQKIAPENLHSVARRHKKSVSIVSIKKEAPIINEGRGEGHLVSKRPTRGHARAASLQVLPHKNDASSGSLPGK